jgi:hypothetical protein
MLSIRTDIFLVLHDARLHCPSRTTCRSWRAKWQPRLQRRRCPSHEHIFALVSRRVDAEVGRKKCEVRRFEFMHYFAAMKAMLTKSRVARRSSEIRVRFANSDTAWLVASAHWLRLKSVQTHENINVRILVLSSKAGWSSTRSCSNPRSRAGLPFIAFLSIANHGTKTIIDGSFKWMLNRLLQYESRTNRLLMCQSGAISVSFTIGSSGAAGLMSLALHFKALRDAQRGQIVD